MKLPNNRWLMMENPYLGMDDLGVLWFWETFILDTPFILPWSHFCEKLRFYQPHPPWESLDSGTFFWGGEIDGNRMDGICQSWEVPEITKQISTWLVVWLPSILFSHILGIIIPIDFHIFQRGGPTTNQISSKSVGLFVSRQAISSNGKNGSTFPFTKPVFQANVGLYQGTWVS